MGYRIKTVAEFTGIPRNTLLAWERRYDVVKPQRQDNGYREYTDEDVNVLVEIKRLVDEGHKVSEAISLLDQKREALRPSTSDLGPRPMVNELREQLYGRLVRFDRTGADRLTHRLKAFPYQQLINELYFPILRRIGEGWERGEVSITQEHYVSQFVREQLVAMLLNLESGPPGGPSVICAGFPEERHDLPILGIAVQLAMQGRRVTLLGADVPTRDICQLVQDRRPDMVCVSLMQPRPTEVIVDYACALRAAAPATCRVVVGGRGLPHKLPNVPGAEFHVDASGLLGH